MKQKGTLIIRKTNDRIKNPQYNDNDNDNDNDKKENINVPSTLGVAERSLAFFRHCRNKGIKRGGSPVVGG